MPYDRITLGDEEIAEMEAMQAEMMSAQQVDPRAQEMQMKMQLKQIELCQIRAGSS